MKSFRNNPFPTIALGLFLWSTCILHGFGQSVAEPGTAAGGPQEPAKGEPIVPQKNLADLDVSELMNIQVTSASKKAESLSQAPAAIFVLTTEDIRRGGFTTLPEALRMVPGLYVTQINPHAWQISARGFSDYNNNKMLVLVDGRSVYSPLYGGVYWDTLDIPLEDVERIEVIRGPGGTLWGANAINGVINIVTKPVEQTQGVLVSTSADINQGNAATVQYGGRVGSKLAYRLFGRSNYWEPFSFPSEGIVTGNFSMTQGGLRIDWQVSDRDRISLGASTYDGRERYLQFLSEQSATAVLKGSSVQASWEHRFSERSGITAMSYCDWYTREDVSGEMRNTCAGEFQHTHDFSERQSLVWGGTLRSTADNLTVTPMPLLPLRRRDTLVSGFAQYSVDVFPRRLRLVGGSKFEHNGYTGFEYQPQFRAVWTPAHSHTIWMAVSRAVRTPARYESDTDVTLPEGSVGGLPLYLEIVGNPNLQSEVLHAYEAGYRFQPAETLALDLALFYNDYPNVVSWNGTVVFDPNMVVNKFQATNQAAAQTHGAELSARWRPFHRWMLSPGVTELRGSPIAARVSPRHEFNLQSRLDLPHRIEFDTSFYHNSPLFLAAVPPFMFGGSVDSVNRVDVGLAWHATPQWTLAIWGRNLQADQHLESLDSFVSPPGEIPRALVFKLTWSWKPEKDN